MTPQHVEVVAVAEDVPLRHPPSVSVEQGSDFLARPDVVADARGHRGSSGIRVRVSLLVPPLCSCLGWNQPRANAEAAEDRDHLFSLGSRLISTKGIGNRCIAVCCRINDGENRQIRRTDHFG